MASCLVVARATQAVVISDNLNVVKAMQAIKAGFEKIKLNAVLMRGRSEGQLLPLVDFANEKGLLLRFIELMPVSSGDVLGESSFLPTAEAKRSLEETFGELLPRTDFRTNGPASYFALPGRDQLVGFIGAMTNPHFCESCNKLRLTCDGKLRPCLGSHLEFDLMKELRAGASDSEVIEFIERVVERKPMEHDFRENYQPGRKMIAASTHVDGLLGNTFTPCRSVL